MFEDRREQLRTAHHVPADVNRTEAPVRQVGELGLVLGGGEVVPPHPVGPCRLLPDRGEPRLPADLVPVHEHEPVTEAEQAVELGLVLGRGEVVPGHPGRTAGLLPDGREVRLPADLVPAHHDRAISQAGDAGELRLVLRRGEPVLGDQRRAGRLLPDPCVPGLAADRVPVDVRGAVAQPCQPVPFRLELVGGQVVPRHPPERPRHRGPYLATQPRQVEPEQRAEPGGRVQDIAPAVRHERKRHGQTPPKLLDDPTMRSATGAGLSSPVLNRRCRLGRQLPHERPASPASARARWSNLLFTTLGARRPYCSVSAVIAVSRSR